MSALVRQDGNVMYVAFPRARHDDPPKPKSPAGAARSPPKGGSDFSRLQPPASMRQHSQLVRPGAAARAFGTMKPITVDPPMKKLIDIALSPIIVIDHTSAPCGRLPMQSSAVQL
jgi:hypothetical protein